MRNEKILVVEFEENSLNSLLQLLQKEGFEVVTAKDGHEGLLKFESESPDLVILEPMLLKLHGFDLCKKITKDSPKKIPVVITTGFYKGEHYKAEAIENFGASAFFEKPYQDEELMTTIHALLANGAGKPVEGIEESIREAQVDKKDAKESVKEMEEKLEQLEESPAKEEVHEEVISDEVSEEDNEADEVSREVDAMLKNAFSEFGLNLEKKKPEGVETGKKAEEEKPEEEDLDKVDVQNLETDHVEEAERGDDDHEEEEEELKTEELIEELIRKEEKVEELDKAEEEVILEGSEEVNISEEELSEEVKEELKTEIEEEAAEEIGGEVKEDVQGQGPMLEEILQQEVKEEEHEPEKKAFEEYFEQPEKASMGVNFFGFLKRIKKSIPIKIGSSVFVILVAAGATYYFLKPNKVSTPLKLENSKILSEVQRTTSDPVDEDFTSGSPEKQKEPAQKNSPLSAPPEGSESDSPQNQAPNVALPSSMSDDESTTEFAASTKLSSRERQFMLPSSSQAPGSRSFEVIEVEDTKESRVETSELTVNLPQLEETAKKIIQPDEAVDRIKTGDLVPIESVDVLPVAERKVNPEYPASAFHRGIEATVEFRALISEFGNVLDVAFSDSGRSLSVFHKACEEAVKQWKFSPAKKNGVNVKVWKTFSIAFKKKNTE